MRELPSGWGERDVLDAAIQRGMLSEDEVSVAREAKDREDRHDIYRPLMAHLVERGAVTARQLARLIDELTNDTREDELPGYQFLSVLGKGSMGTVYLARQKSLQRLVAVKVISRRIARNKPYIESFAREARMAAQITSLYLPRVFDWGTSRGQHFLVMEYIEGRSVDTWLSEGRRLSVPQTLHLAAEVCLALDHLHRMSIIHRDVKPPNMIVSKMGQLVLIDLGLSRHLGDTAQIDAEKGSAIGTPYYISPEQVRGRADIDTRSDLYSLGASVYRMLAGRPLFHKKTTAEVLEAQLRYEPPSIRAEFPEIPEPVDRLLRRLLAKFPEERPLSALALRAEILPLLSQLDAAEGTFGISLPQRMGL